MSVAGERAELVSAARQVLATCPPSETPDVEVRRARFRAGLAFVHFDAEHGGRGADASLNAAVEDVFLEAGCKDWSDINVIGLGMAAPTLWAHGTAEQKRLIEPLFTGEHVWCQLFSEPGAGSDLAALATSAIRDADAWIVNGQKVWTTLAHIASYGLLLARSDPAVSKHRGLTYFVLDMHLPGVEVRPLRQITGEAEFNEVFFTDTHVPDSARLGPVGAGWSVAMTTLSNERSSLGSTVGAPGSGPISQAVALYREAVTKGPVEPELYDRLLRLWAQAETGRLLTTRAAARGGTGPEGSLAKLGMATLNQAVYDLCMDLLGDEALLFDDYTETQPVAAGVHGGTDPKRSYLRTLANSLEGGTSEVQRTIIGERLLGLPPEPRVDKDRPWSEVPRS